MVILVDIGNTRFKWRILAGGRLLLGGALEHRGALSKALLDEQWGEIAPPEAVWCVSVAATDLSRQLEAWCLDRWRLIPRYVTSSATAYGVRNGYFDPVQLGADRWVVMLGAQLRFPGACCIADCGTAVTVDCIDQQGQHRGGIILPGLRLMSRCVVENTQRVTPGELSHEDWLGRNTESCLAAGARHAVIGSLEHVASQFEKQLAMPVARIITGGDAASLLPLLESNWHHEPELAFMGLARLAASVAS